MDTSYARQQIEYYFPALRDDTYDITSPMTPVYNCIGWAAGDDKRFWWPDTQMVYYWPPGVPREETKDAFLAAFATQGYVECADPISRGGYQKVAIYINPVTGTPTHAARQLDDGSWTSKLGSNHDIFHATLDGLCGKQYGQVGFFMERQLKT